VAYSGFPVLTSSPRSWIWKEVVTVDMTSNVAADLSAIGHRIQPVQAGPDSGVVNLMQHAVQVGVSSLRLHQLRNSGLIRP
jgi:hypothetical protein